MGAVLLKLTKPLDRYPLDSNVFQQVPWYQDFVTFRARHPPPQFHNADPRITYEFKTLEDLIPVSSVDWSILANGPPGSQSPPEEVTIYGTCLLAADWLDQHSADRECELHGVAQRLRRERPHVLDTHPHPHRVVSTMTNTEMQILANVLRHFSLEGTDWEGEITWADVSNYLRHIVRLDVWLTHKILITRAFELRYDQQKRLDSKRTGFAKKAKQIHHRLHKHAAQAAERSLENWPRDSPRPMDSPSQVTMRTKEFVDYKAYKATLTPFPKFAKFGKTLDLREKSRNSWSSHLRPRNTQRLEPRVITRKRRRSPDRKHSGHTYDDHWNVPIDISPTRQHRQGRPPPRTREMARAVSSRSEHRPDMSSKWTPAFRRGDKRRRRFEERQSRTSRVRHRSASRPRKRVERVPNGRHEPHPLRTYSMQFPKFDKFIQALGQPMFQQCFPVGVFVIHIDGEWITPADGFNTNELLRRNEECTLVEGLRMRELAIIGYDFPTQGDGTLEKTRVIHFYDPEDAKYLADVDYGRPRRGSLQPWIGHSITGLPVNPRHPEDFENLSTPRLPPGTLRFRSASAERSRQVFMSELTEWVHDEYSNRGRPIVFSHQGGTYERDMLIQMGIPHRHIFDINDYGGIPFKYISKSQLTGYSCGAHQLPHRWDTDLRKYRWNGSKKKPKDPNRPLHCPLEEITSAFRLFMSSPRLGLQAGQREYLTHDISAKRSEQIRADKSEILRTALWDVQCELETLQSTIQKNRRHQEEYSRKRSDSELEIARIDSELDQLQAAKAELVDNVRLFGTQLERVATTLDNAEKRRDQQKAEYEKLQQRLDELSRS